MRRVLFGDEARAKLAEGVEIMFRGVACTLGPKGRNVLMEKHPLLPPLLSKDGVTASKEIRDLGDPFLDMACNVLREAASRTSDQAGDGTTTSIVLARNIFVEGMKHLANGANPVALKRGIDKAVAVIVERLKEMAIPVQSDEQIIQVGTISSNGDRFIGQLVMEAMKKAGKDGIITLDDATGPETYLEFSEGMQFDRGLIAQPMITDPERMECRLDNPYILLTERKIPAMTSHLEEILEICFKRGRPILVVAGDYDKPFIVVLIHSRQQGGVISAAVKAPAFGAQRTAMLEDMAVVTGGYAFTEDCGRKLEHIGIEDLGEADRIVITPTTTTIIGGRGSRDRIDSRVSLLRTLAETSKDALEGERVRQRLARMASGIAVIRVGGQTEVEQKELKDRVEDAIMATRAATEEGILPGGGFALLECKSVVDALIGGVSDPDESLGMAIIKSAIESPARQISINAGNDPEDMVYSNSRWTHDVGWGYNAATEQWEDLMLAGVIDPAKVTRVALQNAASVAAAMLTMETMIADVRDHAKA